MSMHAPAVVSTSWPWHTLALCKHTISMSAAYCTTSAHKYKTGMHAGSFSIPWWNHNILSTLNGVYTPIACYPTPPHVNEIARSRDESFMHVDPTCRDGIMTRVTELLEAIWKDFLLVNEPTFSLGGNPSVCRASPVLRWRPGAANLFV